MYSVKFSHNFNKKLFCNCFTSFRVFNDAKYKIGRQYLIRLKIRKEYRNICEAELVTYQVFKLEEVPEYLARLDTGFTKEDFIQVLERIYINYHVDIHQANFMMLLFKKILIF